MPIPSYYKALSERGRKMANARWDAERKRRRENPPEPGLDDARQQAMQERKGKIYRIITSENPDTGELHKIVLRFSAAGRTDQFDVEVDGKPHGKPTGLWPFLIRWVHSAVAGADPEKFDPGLRKE